MHSSQKWAQTKPRYGDVPPNQTLYVNNLNEKISIQELKCCLLELFSTYGEVIDIIAQGSQKKKGQAFIVLGDISCATNALRALQGFTLLDKQIRVAYCKTKSDTVAHDDGTWKPRAKAGAIPVEGKDDKKKPPGTPPRPGMKGTGKGGAASTPPPPVFGKGSGGGSGAATPPPPQAPKSMVPQPSSEAKKSADVAESDAAQPSNVLFVENLPAEVNEMMLTMLFRQYPGFQEARLIKGRNVAFIEYGDELQAGIAKHGLQGFMVTPDMALKIAFAKQ